MDRMDAYYEYMMEAEAAVTVRNPIYEAEYMQDGLESPNCLYDSFTARLREFHLHKAAYTPEHLRR